MYAPSAGTLIVLALICYTLVDADFPNNNRRQPTLMMLARGGFNPSRHRYAKRFDVSNEYRVKHSQPFFSNYLYQLLGNGNEEDT